jgi:hypothetical protein
MVVVEDAAEPLSALNGSIRGRLVLDRPDAAVPQPLVRPLLVIVRDVFANAATQVSLVQRDHAVETLGLYRQHAVVQNLVHTRGRHQGRQALDQLERRELSKATVPSDHARFRWGRLSARNAEAQRQEVLTVCNILNKMTDHGMPNSMALRT